MRAYKFLEPKHAAMAVSQCVFYIGSIQDYASMEGPQRDHYDGAQLRAMGRIEVKAGVERSELLKRQLDAANFEVCPGANVVIGGVTLVKRTGGLALCLSASSENGAAFPGKTAVIEIACIETFASLLNWANRPPFTSIPDARIVEYREIERAFDPDEKIQLNPFVKRPQYREEQEIRIYWPQLNTAGFVSKPFRPPTGLLRRVA